MSRSNEYTQAVVQVMQKLYPEKLADTAWDNVGLLLDNAEETGAKKLHRRILLTNDLTTAVAEEAILYDVDVIIAYHPIIFRGLKALTMDNAQQAILLRLARHNVAVYCPHTALDAGVGGINDWLAEVVEEAGRKVQTERAADPQADRYTRTTQFRTAKDVLDRHADFVSGQNEVGYGRVIRLEPALPAEQLIRAIAGRLGDMRHVLVARPQTRGLGARPGLVTREQRNQPDAAAKAILNKPYGRGRETVSNVAVCAGSGWGVLKKASVPIHLYVTGEMSHHEALEATSQGAWVMCVLHSNSERRFLAEKLRRQLTDALKTSPVTSTYADTAVLVSEYDRDPYEFWDVSEPLPEPKVPGKTDATSQFGI